MSQDADLFDAIDRSEPIELLARLAQIPSHPGVPNQEAGVAEALADFLERGGLRTELVEVADSVVAVDGSAETLEINRGKLGDTADVELVHADDE